MVEKKAYKKFVENDTFTLNFIDQYFKNYVLSLGGKEYYVPSMISREILEKCGYFNSYPQHLTAAAHVDREYYDDVVKSQTVQKGQIKLEDQFLTPAVCLHLYPMLEGEIIDDRAVTMFGRVYRYEDGGFDGLIRFWDYAVREIVFIGSPDYVKEKLEVMEDETKRLVERMDLPAEIREAHDHFYPSEKNKLRKKIQIANQTKDELLVFIDGKEVAISSFNYHGTHFSKVFHFDNNNKTVTGCVGYGLERWVAAINTYNIDLKELNISKEISLGAKGR